MLRMEHQCSPRQDAGGCESLPAAFTRLRYFFGKRMSVADFVDEALYHNGKRRLHNLRLHGAGVLCGLSVSILEDTTERMLRVTRGAALDGCGREIIVGHDQCIDMGAWYRAERARRRENDPDTTWPAEELDAEGRLPVCVHLAYHECQTHPEPAPRDPCRCGEGGCEFGRVEEDHILSIVPRPRDLADGTPPVEDPGAAERPRLYVAALLADPVGPDRGREWIEVANLERREVSLAGWTLSDEQGDHALTGVVGPRERLRVTLPADARVKLANDGDEVVLRQGDRDVHRVRYGPQSPGRPQDFDSPYRPTPWSKVSPAVARNLFPTGDLLRQAVDGAATIDELYDRIGGLLTEGCPAKPEDAGFMLSCLRLDLNPGLDDVVRITDLDPMPPPLLSTSALQYLLLELIVAVNRLHGDGLGPEIIDVRLERLSADDSTYQFRIPLSSTIMATTVDDDLFRLVRLDPGTGWDEPGASAVHTTYEDVPSPALLVRVNNSAAFLDEAFLYRLSVVPPEDPVVDGRLRPLRPANFSFSFGLDRDPANGALRTTPPPMT